jgi:hypothetical protein
MSTAKTRSRKRGPTDAATVPAAAAENAPALTGEQLRVLHQVRHYPRPQQARGHAVSTPFSAADKLALKDTEGYAQKATMHLPGALHYASARHGHSGRCARMLLTPARLHLAANCNLQPAITAVSDHEHDAPGGEIGYVIAPSLH